MKTANRHYKQKGSVIVTVAFAMIAMAGATGLAVDIGRAQLAQAKLSSALDAAGLAAGSNLNTQDTEAEVLKYLDANFGGYMSTTLTDVDVTVNESNTVITLDATGFINTTFMNYFGFPTVDISAEAEITRATTGLEVVLALDNTGSMGDSGIAALKEASTDLVNILFGDGTASNLYVGLVPFSQAVNVGSDKTAWLNSTTFNWGPTSWGGCLDARYTGNDVTDAPPSVEAFQQYYWPDDSNNDWIRSNGQYRSITSTRGPNKSCPQRLLEMTSDQAAVLAAIDTMNDDGYTHINLGAVWAWRMLSPLWRGLWGGEMNTENLPLDYNTPKMNKAVVLMTDGENTMNSSVRTAYWYPSHARLGTTSTSAAADELDDRTMQVCDAMKTNNIIIYTVAFNNPGAGAEALLQYCASQPEFYFDSPTSEDLASAFRTIGDSLSNLRVSR